MASTLGALNPFRYRGYVYDTETGLYYLQSRYYDPEVGRFLNADIYMSTGQGILGNNMYVYCLNSPVNMSDDSGTRSVWDKAKVFLVDVLKASAVVAGVALATAAIISTGGGALALAAGGVSTSAAAASAAGTAVLAGKIGIAAAGTAGLIEASQTIVKATSVNQMQEQVRTNRAPKEVKRVDNAHTDKGQAHIHFKDGTSMNKDGTIHDALGGIPKITNKVAKWLSKNGWTRMLR